MEGSPSTRTADLGRLVKFVSPFIEERKHAIRTVKDETEKVDLLELKVKESEEVQSIIQKVGEALQRGAHEKIAEVVSKCLAAVFDHPYEFRIVFEKKRGKTDARIAFFRDGEEFSPKAVGGGVLDVVGFALRLAAIVLVRPPLRRLLLLDEPFKHLSRRREYRERMRDLLLQLSKEMGVQMVVVTHDDELTIGKVIEL